MDSLAVSERQHTYAYLSLHKPKTQAQQKSVRQAPFSTTSALQHLQ